MQIYTSTTQGSSCSTTLQIFQSKLNFLTSIISITFAQKNIYVKRCSSFTCDFNCRSLLFESLHLKILLIVYPYNFGQGTQNNKQTPLWSYQGIRYSICLPMRERQSHTCYVVEHACSLRDSVGRKKALLQYSPIC